MCMYLDTISHILGKRNEDLNSHLIRKPDLKIIPSPAQVLFDFQLSLVSTSILMTVVELQLPHPPISVCHLSHPPSSKKHIKLPQLWRPQPDPRLLLPAHHAQETLSVFLLHHARKVQTFSPSHHTQEVRTLFPPHYAWICLL